MDGGGLMAYTYLKTEVKAISMAELEALQNAYAEAEKKIIRLGLCKLCKRSSTILTLA
jgi:hypothetical protein